MIEKIVLLLVIGFLFLNIALANEMERTGIIGDVNDDGEVTEFDASMILRFIEAGYSLSEDQQVLADVNEDGIIDHKDAVVILQEQVNFFQEEALPIAPAIATLTGANADEVFAPRITFPQPQGNIFYAETIALSGIASPNSYIYIFKNQDLTWSEQTTSRSNGYWSIGLKVKETGTIYYTAKVRNKNKGWLVSNSVIVERQNPSSFISLFFQEMPSATRKVVKNVVYGRIENIGELPVNILADLIIVGDIRDFGQQAYYWVTGSKEFSKLVMGASAFGILSTVAPGADLPASIAKQIGKQTAKIASKAPVLSQAIIKATKTSAKTLDAGSLDSIGNLLFKLQKRDLDIFEQIVKDSDDAVRLSQYSKRYADEGLEFVEKMAKRSKEVNFEWNSGGLQHAWEGHLDDWKKLNINSPAELDKIVKEITTGGKPSRRVISKYKKSPDAMEDQFGFYEEGSKIFIPADFDGKIPTAFPAERTYLETKEFLFEF